MALQKIKLSSGKIREVQDHLAFDAALQKQQGFVPCDDNGVPITGTAQPEKKRTGQAAEVAAEANALTDNPLNEPTIEQQMLEAHHKGLSFVEIGKEHGMHWKKVESIIKKANQNDNVTK